MIRKYQVLSRFMAFLAVSVAIAAVAWLSNDYSLLAIGIPGLAAGHYYSWRRPKVSFLRSLTFVAIMVLTLYLGDDILQTRLSDRLLLSRYLIYGLVLGSFDLMRRGHVMASVILGALLMILVSELALNFLFLFFLVPFLIFSMISAVISRVELEAAQAPLVGKMEWRNPVKAWLGFTATILVIASVLFLTMPRVASGQVTQASWLPSRLDLTLGGPLLLPSRPGASVTPGILPFTPGGEGTGDGQYVPLGYTGNLADRVVMNVRSRVSSYWRGLTLDVYDGIGWVSSESGLGLRPNGEGAFLLSDSRINPRNERNYWQIYYLLTDQPNAVFTGYNPGTIYLPDLELGYLERGTLYRTLSATPFLRPEQLRLDNVFYEDFFYLALPGITDRTAELAESIVEGAETDYDKAARIEQFLADSYPYKLDIEPLPSGRDAVDYFLFEQQAGYCSSFATAMAVMARHVGLPARIAAGYLPGYIDPLTGAHIVRVGDAHAWVEIFFQRHGWVSFDPTPRADAAMGFATGRNWVYFGLDDFTGTRLTEILAPLGNTLSLGRLLLPAWLWGVALSIVIGLIVIMLRFRLRRKSTHPVLITYTSLDGESRRAMLKMYQKMNRLLLKKGIPGRPSSQSLLEYGDMASNVVPGGRDIIERITGLTLKAAYDPAPFQEPDSGAIKTDLNRLKKELSRPRS